MPYFTRVSTVFFLCLFLTGLPVSAQSSDPLETKGVLDILTLAEFNRVMENAKGKVVVVNFWASWCPACRAGFPELAAVHKNFKESELLILGLSVDEDNTAYKKAVIKENFQYPVRRVGRDISAKFQVSGIPKMFIYSPKGELLAEQTGPVAREALTAFIQNLLKKTAGSQ